MAGVLFVVTVPRKLHEEEIKRKKKSKLFIEKEKYENTSKIIDELKRNQLLGNLKSNIESSHNENVCLSKCKSTDCLHKDEIPKLYKSNSENILNKYKDLENDSYMKSSWDEFKNAMRPKRSKLKISRSRGVDILDAFHWDTPLETILSEVVAWLDINTTWHATRDNKFMQVIFSIESNNLCEELLQVLRTFGIGSRHHSSVSVIPCALYYNSSYSELTPAETNEFKNVPSSAWARFSSSVRARTNLAQVLHDVRSDAALTFDWLFLLIVAAFVAAIGLVEDSTVILVASMLISPLMGPITAGTLGTAVRDRSLQQMGVMHELLGLFLSLVIGFIFGLAICAVDEHYGVGDWPTNEMMSRCEIRSLWVGVLVAIPSGGGVALAVLGDYTASLVGVAISASLLPPAVNAGLLWAMALVHLIFLEDDTKWTSVVKTSLYSDHQPTELAVLGTVSLCLTLVNIVCIFLVGVAVYKVKEVCPLNRRDMSWWRANKNFLQSSKKCRHEDPEHHLWDTYRELCDENLQAKQDTEKDIAGQIQSETITYRRHQIGAQRLKAQNIEAYCLSKQNNETYRSLGPLPTPDWDDEKEKAETTSKTNEDNPAIDFRHKEETYRKLSCPDIESNDNYGFYNLGYQDVDKTSYNINVEETNHPTLEPSLNYTVDSNKYGVILGNKSFHV